MTYSLRSTFVVATIALLGSLTVQAGVPISKPTPGRPAAKQSKLDRLTLTSLALPFSPYAQVVDIDTRRRFGGVYLDLNDFDVDTGAFRQKTFVYYDGQYKSITHQGDLFTLLGPTVVNSDLTIGNWGSDTAQQAGFYNLKTGAFTNIEKYDDGRAINLGWRFTTNGTVVGSSCEGSLYDLRNCVGWLWDGQSFTAAIKTPWAPEGPAYAGTVATSINDRGQIVGYYGDASGNLHPFLMDKGVYTSLDVPNLPCSQALDINNSGQVLIAPCFGLAGTSVLYDRGTFSELPEAPGSFVTIYMGMNDSGDFAGIWLGDGFPFIATKK